MNVRLRLSASNIYVGVVIAAGFLTIVQSGFALRTDSPGYQWLLLAALTLISGSATVKLPSVPATISVSETFVFTAVLLFGQAAGTIIVALDGFIISLWLRKRVPQFSRLLFNVAAPALSIWTAANILKLTGVRPLIVQPTSIGELILPLLLFTVVYFSLNSWLIACAIGLDRRVSPVPIWRQNFLWLSLNYFSGASVAALLVVYTRGIDLTYLAVILPLLLALYLTFKTSMDRVQDANVHLAKLNSLYLSTIETLAMAIDAKDQITHGHIRRVQTCAVRLARALGIEDEIQIKAIEAAALLHDMGKLAVPEYILNKPGRLTPAEFDKMKLHASVGADILTSIDFPYPVVPIVRHHHENWTGGGYPDGLKGTDIPIGARILSVVDCFDALTSDRPYRPRLSDDEAIRILLDRRGTMYDPLIVDTFIQVYRDIAPTESTQPASRKALLAITEASHTSSTGVLDRTSLDNITASSEEMLALYELAGALSGQVNLGDAAEIITKHLRRIVPSSLCVFYIYNLGSDELVAAHAFGEGAAIIEGLRIKTGERLSGWVAANRQTILNSDPVLDLGDIARTTKPRLRSCLSTALEADGQLVGVLSLYSPAVHAFTDDHRRVLETISRQVSQTVRHSIEFERTKEQVLRDPLTGLPNLEYLKRIFDGDERLKSVLTSPFSLVIIEATPDTTLKADHFGETAKTVAQRLRAGLRGGDLLFRYDDLKFIAVLPQTDATVSSAISHRLCESIVDHTSSLSVLLRFAAATAPEDALSLIDLLGIARRRVDGAIPTTLLRTDRPVVH